MSVNKNLIITLLVISVGNTLFAQTPLSPYVIFGGQKDRWVPSRQTTPLAPGYGVQIGPTNTIQGGSIGSYHLVKSTGNLTLGTSSNPTNIYSWGIIQLVNSNIVTGKITAANQFTLPLPLAEGSTILSVGSSAVLGNNAGGDIDVRGSIVIGGGSVLGKVTIPPNITTPPEVTYTYSGPPPAGGPPVRAVPTLPTLPVIHDTIIFDAAGSTNISTTKKIAPGSYGDVTLGGNKTLTLDGPGIYIFKSIKNSGTSNNFVFNFKNKVGNIRVYVHGNVDLGKIKASLDSVISYSGGPAMGESRVYLETHGRGVSASNPASFIIANGSAGSASKWVGTVYAPFAAINVGSGTGSTNLTGALWSGTQVNLQSGISMVYAPFTFCDPPNIDAGPDRPLDFSSLTTLKDNLNNATSYKWRTIGGVITSDPTKSSITVSTAGIYILTADSTGNCYARDTVKISSKLKSLIGSELQSIYDNKTTDNTFFDIQNDSVMIDVIVNTGYKKATYDTLIKPNYGLNPDTLSNGTSKFIITGKFPVINLPKLNYLYTLINYCMPHNYGVTYNGIDMVVVDTILGKVRTAGDTSLRSYLVRKGYNLTGEGVKVGIISNSYNTIASSRPDDPIKTYNEQDDRKNGDLPDINKPYDFSKRVTVLKDLPNIPSRSDEGRAMAQTIHDIAPGAELYFHTGSFSAGDFAQGIRRLDSAGCNVIVDDITYITEPFLKDGVVANAVDTAKKHGVSYFSAAGNFASKSYEKNFDSLPAPAGFAAGTAAHNFGGSAIRDIYESITLSPGAYTFVLQWVDSIHSTGQGGTKFDMDIYLTPNTDGTALFGFNRDNTDGDPIEFIPFTVDNITTTNIMVVNNTIGKGQPSRFKIIVFRGDITFNEYMTADVVTSTVTGQANASGAITIGAARYNKTDIIEYYSSTGGTVVKGQIRNKPDLVGPDGVNTTVKMGNLDYDGDSYYNFFGTSAAAPQAAAVAALIMEGRKRFRPTSPTTSDTIRSVLDSTAIDMYSPNFDFNSGYGFIRADLAMKTIAEPTSNLIDKDVPANIIPGTVPFNLTITGENFSSNSEVVLVADGDTTRISPNTISTDGLTNELTVTIDTFSRSPEILVYTPPKTAFGDGGYSNSLNFFDADIVVRAVSDTIKYGQPLPSFNPINTNNTIITINDTLLQNSNRTLESIGLASMVLNCNANGTSDVGEYDIIPTRTFDKTNPVDSALLVKYNYKFIKGNLKIKKLPVTLTANDITATYGDKLPDVSFTYKIDDPAGISDPGTLLNQIQTGHQSQLAKDGSGHDILGLVNDQAVVIENDQAVVIENDQAVVIENGHTYALRGDSARQIINDTSVIVSNGKVTSTNGYTLTTGDIANLSFLASEESLNNFRTVNSTKVIDITQESILGFIKNGAQTTMLNSVSNVNPKGLLDINSYTNEQAVVIENDQAVVIENGIPNFNLVNEQAVVIENDQAVVIENDQAVVIENGVISINPNGSPLIIENDQAVVIENTTGNRVPILFSNNKTAVIVDSSEVRSGNWPSNVTPLNIISGFEAGDHFISPASFSGTTFSNNFAVTHVPGKLKIQKRTITVTANAVSRQYLDPNPVLTVTYSGFAPGESLENSDIKGTPDVTTSITPTTPVGVYPNSIVVTNGTLSSSNYTFVFVNGTFTVTTNPCLLTRAPFNNFGSTSKDPTSLWLNIETKVSGQLKQQGRYLLFKFGTVSFNDIVNGSLVKIPTAVIPNGIIIADDAVKLTGPRTHFSADSNMWVTQVPVGFSSTSDIFITGAIINSSNGFIKTKKNANSNTVVQGAFYSDTVYSDQWTYGIAAYQPIFDSSSIDDYGQVASINGTYYNGSNYHAGAPLPFVNNVSPQVHLVNGASGGGGNNYTGSTSSFDNFTACRITSSIIAGRNNNSSIVQEVDLDATSAGEVSIIPNPASDYINLSFVSKQSGNSKIVLYSIDGSKVFEMNNGTLLKDQKYVKRIDVSKLINGMYFVQIWNANNVTSKKIIINR